MQEEQHLIMFDPSVGSFNLGDNIISKSVNYEMRSIFENYFCFRFSTHLPNYELWQMNKRNERYVIVRNADLKFICGTNIISANLLNPWPNFNLNCFNKKIFRNSVLVAAGSVGALSSKINSYTKSLYKYILSDDFVHSTRDEKTKKFIESLGKKAVNTGCATMWRLTDEFCRIIPCKKSESVVFTLTNDQSDIKYDAKLIELLKRNYRKVYFCPQSAGDIKYFNSLKTSKNDIEILPPDIDCISDFYENNNVDYVGTRLHGGIFAMQNRKRSIILSVDNRAEDISSTYNINCIKRENLDELENKINSDFPTEVHIDCDKISEWKAQFS